MRKMKGYGLECFDEWDALLIEPRAGAQEKAGKDIFSVPLY